MPGPAFGLQQTAVQKTTLNLSQRQSVELLQLTSVELEQSVEAILATNPLVESVETTEVPEPETHQPSVDESEAGVAHDFKEPNFLTWGTSPVDDDDFDPFAKVATSENLTDVLLQQVGELHLTDAERSRVQWLIGNLDENGFLPDGLECTESCPEHYEAAEWQDALDLLQSLDPAGVGASTAIESLTLQLERQRNHKNEPVIDLAIRLLTETKDLVAKRDFKSAARILSTTPEASLEAYRLICTLNPHPGANYADTANNQTVIPEIVVQKTVKGLIAVLNPAVVPTLRFDSESYELITKAKLTGDEKTAWKEKAAEAKLFVRSLEQRFATITAVAQAIIDAQPDFFEAGPTGLKPMGLKDIAMRLSMAESTVSRACAGKYMQTPLGTFEFKSFFTSSVAGSDGLSVSSSVVRKRITELVAAENPQKPLSDAAIADLLAKEGIELARRTVAKYRELEHIAPKSLRKALG